MVNCLGVYIRWLWSVCFFRVEKPAKIRWFPPTPLVSRSIRVVQCESVPLSLILSTLWGTSPFPPFALMLLFHVYFFFFILTDYLLFFCRARRRLAVLKVEYYSPASACVGWSFPLRLRFRPPRDLVSFFLTHLFLLFALCFFSVYTWKVLITRPSSPPYNM